MNTSLRNLLVLGSLSLISVVSAQTGSSVPSEEVVRLSAFEVTAQNDRGYGTTNSLGATRMNISVMESPQVVITLNEKFMEDSGLIEMEDLAGYVAGFARGSTKGAGTVTMRGQEIGGLGLTDGLREGLVSLSSYDMIGVGRYEFIKGPAGALYGSHAVGGVVNRVMKRPLNTPQTMIKFMIDEIAGENLARMEIDTSRRLLDSKFGYRFAAAFQDGKAQGRNNDNRTALYSFVDYQLAQNAKVWMRWEGQFFDRTTPSHTFRAAAYDPAFPKHRSLGLGVLPVTTVIAGPGNSTFKLTNIYLGEAGFQYDVARWSLKFVARYSYDDGNRQTYHGNNFDFVSATGTVIGNQNNTLFENPNWVDIRTRGSTYDVNFDNNTNGGVFVDLAGRFDLGPTTHQMLTYASLFTSDSYGIQLRYNAASQSLINPRKLNMRVQQWQRTNLPPDLTFNAVTQSSISSGDVFTFGVQDNINLFSGRLVLAGGAGFQGARNNSNNRLNPANSIINVENSQWSPSYGVVYRPIPSVSAFLNHSETFRPRTGFDSLGNALRNGTGESDELGVKVNLWEGRLTATAAVFKTVEDGFIVATVINGFPASIQAGEATNKGWELDLTARPFPGLDIIGGVSDLEGESENGAFFRNANTGFNWSLFAHYEISRGPLDGFAINLGYKSVADRFGDGANTFILPGYETVSSGVGYSRKQWRVQLQVENLLDKEYLVSAVNFSNIYFGDPRRIRISTTFRF
jgi:iron complex outermembrane receptor protein